MLTELFILQNDRFELLIGEDAAIEQEPHPARSVWPRPKEVDADEAAMIDPETALLASLPLARLPG